MVNIMVSGCALTVAAAMFYMLPALMKEMKDYPVVTVTWIILIGIAIATGLYGIVREAVKDATKGS